MLHRFWPSFLSIVMLSLRLPNILDIDISEGIHLQMYHFCASATHLTATDGMLEIVDGA